MEAIDKNLYVLIEYESTIQGIGHSVYLHNKINELADGYFHQNYNKLAKTLDQEALLYLKENPEHLNNYYVNYASRD